MTITYRREIDGLRALAVLPVILFHAGFKAFGGGFVGVDIFFVISGYLITSIILDEYDNDHFTLKDFYLRRARRILPALFLVIFVCFPFAWQWYLPVDMKEFSQSVVATTTFLSNFFFWLKTGYFDTEAELKPLLHTWSLAVEEQYYLIFPAFFVWLIAFQKKWALWVLSVLAIISLAYAQWLSTKSLSANFFLFPSRLWELLIGALIALYLFHKSKPIGSSDTRQFASAIGLFLIASSIILYSNDTPYPSIYTLLPTGGAGLFILFADKDNIAGKILSSKIFVGLGMVSYSAYLWHQPLLAFARYKTFGELSNELVFSLLIATFGLAYLSWRFVENPFRKGNRLRTSRFIFIFLCLGGVLILTGVLGHRTNGFVHRQNGKLPAEYFTQAQADRKFNYGIDNKLCISNEASLCQVSEFIANRKNILLLGDSHSSDFTNQFKTYATHNQLNAWQMSITGCAYLFSQLSVNTECQKAKSILLEKIKHHDFDQIILVGNYFYHTMVGPIASRQLDINAVVELIDQILKSNVEVIFFMPRMNFNFSPPRAAILDSLEKLKLMSNERNELAWLAGIDSLKKYKNFHVFDQNTFLLRYGCGEPECFKGHTKDIQPLYRDSSHLTEFGSEILFNNYLGDISKSSAVK
jgi:peptidoglycan/LPS O-acetylase OafA/YrhL